MSTKEQTEWYRIPVYNSDGIQKFQDVYDLTTNSDGTISGTFWWNGVDIISNGKEQFVKYMDKDSMILEIGKSRSEEYLHVLVLLDGRPI